jgi:hypothetical protein
VFTRLVPAGEFGELRKLEAVVRRCDPRDPLLDEIRASLEGVSDRVVRLSAHKRRGPQAGHAPPDELAKSARSDADVRPAATAVHGGFWGVVTTAQARVFNSDGHFLSAVPAGTLVDIVSLKQTRSGKVAEGSVLAGQQTLTEALVRARDLEIVAGQLSAAPREERQLRVRYAELVQRLNELDKGPAPDGDSENPFALEFKKAKDDYVQYWRKIHKLQTARDTVTGDERVRYEDELRRLKAMNLRLSRAYERAKAKYNGWKNDNAQRPGENPERKLLLSELERVQRGLEEYPPAMAPR